MPLPSFLQRFTRRDAGPSVQAQPLSPSDIEQTRVRARRRMIGMAVLVGAGVIGFPWLFETQPRPMAPDVAVVSKAASSGVRGAQTPSDRAVVAATSPAVPPVVSRALDAERSAAVAQARQEGRSTGAAEPREEIIEDETPVPRPATARTEPPVPKPVPKPATAVAKPVPTRSEPLKPEARTAAAKPVPPKPVAAAKPPSKPEAKPVAAADDTRYIVQVGAFSDGPTAHAARMKVERLGIKTYTQAVNTPAGRKIRVRVGPYANKVEADKAAAAIRKAGLPGALLTL
ncbi:MAG: SPOR domain-containing protein [Rubrivivax sp.]|nr:MAG: SPOR domain-containing protein [Rubrivivax sp.]